MKGCKTQMEVGHFYFISDSFYQKYDTDKKLMQNKETIEGKQADRPCFFAFNDRKQAHIYWLIPISSKIGKYVSIYNSKIQKQRQKGVKNPKCNTIRFGDVLGQKRAFLIQNMFPITRDYILSTYIDKNTNSEVMLSADTEKDIITNAEDVLRLARRGVPILFTDINAIYNGLLSELQQL